jgi:hypothetical protein
LNALHLMHSQSPSAVVGACGNGGAKVDHGSGVMVALRAA